MNKFLRIGLLCLFVVIAIANVELLAQERFSSIVGVIYDPSKAVMPGVEITIQNLETKRTFRTTSGNDGKYYARDLEPGRYSISARKEGFTRAEFSDVILLLGKTINLNFTLQVGQLTESVIVLGTSTLIDTNTTAVTHNVTSDEFDFMPKDRSFQSVALTSPSVNSGQIEGGIQVNGASGAENQYTIDGISTTSLLDGTSRQNAPYEFLQEVQVKTSGLEAEYGGALGGVISAVTKSGGNAFHGEFHWYNSGSPFNADPRVRMTVDPNDLRTIKYFQDQKTTNHVNEVGGSVSGPIVKDKLFFFTSFTPTFRHLEANIQFSDGSSTFTSSERMYSLFDKLTWDATKRIRTNFSWLYTTDKRKGLMAGYNAMSANSNLNTINTYDSIRPQGWYLPKDSYTGTVDVTLSNTSLLSFRGGYFWDNYKVVKAPSTTQLRYNMSATNLPFTIPDSLIHPSGWFNVPLTNVTYFDITSRGYFQADYSKTFRLLGSHNLKGGAGFQKNVNKVFTGYQGGGYNVAIYWDGSFTSPSLGAGRGTYGYYQIRQIGKTGSAGSTTDNMYIQDHWRILPRLSLSLGLRAEKENIPSFRRDIQEYAIQFDWADKLAPRLGASYDVFGNGKLKIFGSWGRFYDWTKYSMVRDSFGGAIWREWYHALDTTDIFSLSMTNMPGSNLWNNTPGSYRDLYTPSFDSSAIDPDIKPMRQDTTVIGAEYQFTPITVFSAHYVHSILNRTIEDIGQILPDGNTAYTLGGVPSMCDSSEVQVLYST